MNDTDTTPDGAGPYDRARYFVLTADDGLQSLLRTPDGRPVEDGEVEKWDPPTGLWEFSGYLSARLTGMGGDADDTEEIDAADVPELITDLMADWAGHAND